VVPYLSPRKFDKGALFARIKARFGIFLWLKNQLLQDLSKSPSSPLGLFVGALSVVEKERT
jgi:hypothetical protein